MATAPTITPTIRNGRWRITAVPTPTTVAIPSTARSAPNDSGGTYPRMERAERARGRYAFARGSAHPRRVDLPQDGQRSVPGATFVPQCGQKPISAASGPVTRGAVEEGRGVPKPPGVDRGVDGSPIRRDMNGARRMRKLATNHAIRA